MSMDQELADMYGTTTEDQEKVAEVALFAKLAAKHEIDLSKYSDEQVVEMYEATMGKTAEEELPDDEQEAKLAAAAQAEFQVKREWQEKVAECDKLGRVMAHAYVQELGLIEKAAGEVPPQFAKKDEGEKKDKESEEPKDEEGKDEEKEASAVDVLAARHAVELAKEAGIDPAIAARKLDAVLTLGGPGPSEKTASANSFEESIHIRALEFLETAGYPVAWAE